MTEKETMTNSVRIEVKRLSFDPDTREPIAIAIEPSVDGARIVGAGEPLVFEMTNDSTLPLYMALINLDDNGASNQLYPYANAAHESVAPGQTISLGLTRQRSRQFRPTLAPNARDATEHLTLFATTDRTSFEKWIQDRSVLNQHSDNDWITAQTQVMVVLATHRHTGIQPLQSGAPVKLPTSQLRIEASPGTKANAYLLSSAEYSRSGASENTAFPPSLNTLSANVQPLNLASTRSTGSGGNAIEIEFDVGGTRSVSPQTPLNLHLPREIADGDDTRTAGLFAVAFDGELFHLVGRSGVGEIARRGTPTDDSVIRIDWLPEAGQYESELPQQRGAGRTLKLYLYKLRDLPESTTGLHAVSVTSDHLPAFQLSDAPEGALLSAKFAGKVFGSQNADVVPKHMRTAHNYQVHYWEAEPNQIQRGQRVAMIIHGFTSETTPSVAQILPMLTKYGVHYDHFLTFDYETYGTAISENGRMLAAILREAGLAPDDGVHVDIFAHSMGTLVTRSMVEEWGGAELVDRCFLCGPPNRGTPLAAAGQLVPWLSTVMLNFSTIFPPAFLAGWVLGKIAINGAGSRDLHPESDFLSELNSSRKMPTVPYYILAGNHQTSDGPPNSWQLQQAFERSIEAGLEKLFDDQNDMVINVQSMLGVRNGNHPPELLHAKIVQCNHFGYFATDECQGQLARWLQT